MDVRIGQRHQGQTSARSIYEFRQARVQCSVLRLRAWVWVDGVVRSGTFGKKKERKKKKKKKRAANDRTENKQVPRSITPV